MFANDALSNAVLCRDDALPRSKNVFLNFGTPWSDAIQRSDPNLHYQRYGTRKWEEAYSMSSRIMIAER